MNGIQKLQFIINPAAGHAVKVDYELLLNRYFSNGKYETNLTFTQSKGHAAEIVKQAIAGGYHTVVAAGGDGTINEIGNALMHSGIVMGIIPTGSGNGLARHHKIPVNIENALKVIARNNTVTHDAVKINDFISFNVSGIGFDAHVAHLFGQDGRRGFSGYMKLVISEYKNYTNHNFQVINGSETHNLMAAMVSIANASQFGNNAIIAPFAVTNDGITNITALRKMPVMGMPMVFWKLFNNTIHTSSYVNTFSNSSFEIKCSTKLPLHIDGEKAGHSDHFKVTTLPDSIKLLIP